MASEAPGDELQELEARQDPRLLRALDIVAPGTALREGITNARARPVSPVYPQISQAIYKNVNEALAGRASAEDALKTAQTEMQSALETF